MLIGRIEGGKDDVLKWVQVAKKYSPELKFSDSDFLEDIIKSVPIFRKDGDNYYWAHKSLAEYFAASFISMDRKEDQEKICDHFYNNKLSGHKNLLDLLYDIDTNLFNKFYTKKLIKYYEDELQKNIELYKNIPLADIKKRTSVFLDAIASVGDIGGPEEFIKFIAKCISEDNLDVYTYGNNIMILTKPIHVIIEILLTKGHDLILRKQFYPNLAKGVSIVGVARKKNIILSDDPGALWNSLKNFDKTSDVVMKILPGIFDEKKIPWVLSEIKRIDEIDDVTDELLCIK